MTLENPGGKTTPPKELKEFTQCHLTLRFSY